MKYYYLIIIIKLNISVAHCSSSKLQSIMNTDREKWPAIHTVHQSLVLQSLIILPGVHIIMIVYKCKSSLWTPACYYLIIISTNQLTYFLNTCQRDYFRIIIIKWFNECYGTLNKVLFLFSSSLWKNKLLKQTRKCVVIV